MWCSKVVSTYTKASTFDNILLFIWIVHNFFFHILRASKDRSKRLGIDLLPPTAAAAVTASNFQRVHFFSPPSSVARRLGNPLVLCHWECGGSRKAFYRTFADFPFCQHETLHSFNSTQTHEHSSHLMIGIFGWAFISVCPIRPPISFCAHNYHRQQQRGIFF